MSKISVIGAGSVGATIANDLMIQGVASEIVLVDVNKKKAVGEALDIYQGAPFCSPAVVRPGEYSDTEGSDIVVITCGVARKPGMTRLDLAQVNVNILKDVAGNVTKYAPNAIYVIVSNPVDVLTYVFHKISGIPENQIIGSGTILDTSRLQSTLAKRFCISPKNVHAHVYGEHGDSQFVPWSLAHIANNHVSVYRDSSPDRERIAEKCEYAEIEEYVRKSGSRVIARKGATFYAVSMSVCHLCKCILSGVEKMVQPTDVLYYQKTFTFKRTNHRVLLHFGAVDYKCEVTLNNSFVGEHKGGYLPFTFDVTTLILDGENDLRLAVKTIKLNELKGQ